MEFLKLLEQSNDAFTAQFPRNLGKWVGNTLQTVQVGLKNNCGEYKLEVLSHSMNFSTQQTKLSNGIFKFEIKSLLTSR